MIFTKLMKVEVHHDELGKLILISPYLTGLLFIKFKL